MTTKSTKQKHKSQKVIAYIPSMRKKVNRSEIYDKYYGHYAPYEPVIDYIEIPSGKNKNTVRKDRISWYSRLASENDGRVDYYSRGLTSKINPIDIPKQKVQLIPVTEKQYLKAIVKGGDKAQEISRTLNMKIKDANIPYLGFTSSDRTGIIIAEIDKELEKIAIRNRARRRKSGKTSLRR